MSQRYIRGNTVSSIAESVEDAISAGRLCPGSRLPTIRALAKSLTVSPATISGAYDRLKQRGLIMAQGRNGTLVSPRPALTYPTSTTLPEGVVDLSSGNPDPALLPDLKQALQSLDPGVRLYDEALNVPELLELGRKLFVADGFVAEHMAIAGGALDGVERVLQEYLRPGDKVLMGDPGYAGFHDLFRARGFVPIGLPLDDEGLSPGSLRQGLKSGAKAVVLVPRAHNPTGAVQSASRARTLQKILKEFPQVLVVEEDHAAWVAGHALHSVCTARLKRWAAIRSVAKALGPDLRVAFVTGDAHTISRMEGKQLLGSRWVSHILQRLVLALLSNPKTELLLEQAAETYTQRRQSLLAELTRYGISAQGKSGLNVWISVPEETTSCRRLLEQGWMVEAGERFRFESPAAIRVTVSSLQPDEAARFASDLNAIVHSKRARTRV